MDAVSCLVLADRVDVMAAELPFVAQNLEHTSCRETVSMVSNHVLGCCYYCQKLNDFVPILAKLGILQPKKCVQIFDFEPSETGWFPVQFPNHWQDFTALRYRKTTQTVYVVKYKKTTW